MILDFVSIFPVPFNVLEWFVTQTMAIDYLSPNKINMKKFFFLVTTSLFFTFCSSAQVRVQNLLCENMVNPIGLDILNPRFSWQLITDKRNTLQTGYEIIVSITAGKNVKHSVWSSGKTISQQSVYVPYAGSALQPNHTYYWQVRVWDNSGKVF
jgi:alpha-L-rhamnosidase